MITTPILHDLVISRDILEEVLSYVSVQNNFFIHRYPNTLFDQSVLSHIAYVENKKLGFHNLTLNIKKAGFRGRWVNYTALDPWFDYYKMGVLPLFYNYINLTEILQLMPTRSVLNVSQNNLIDIARIIQFFETTRYIEAFYLNREVSFGDYKSFMIIITPAELLLYDLNYQLLGKIDFINSKVTYIGLQKLGLQNFFTYIKSLTYKFTKLLPEVNFFRKKSWLEIRKPVSAISENKIKAPWKWFRKQEVMNKSFLQEFSFLKKSYMKKYGLDVNNVEQFNAFQFQVIKITNPFWLKWGTRVILPKKNIQWKDKHNTSTALKILQNKKYDLDTNKLFSLFQEGASLMTEINQKMHTWKKDTTSTKPRPDRFWNLGEWSTAAELTYTDVDNYEGNREEDRGTELPAIMDILVPFINNPGWRTQKEYTKITRAEVGLIPEQSSKEFYKVLDMYAHLKNNPYKSRFIVRDKYESLYGFSPVDRFHLQQIRTKINKLEHQINAFNANEQWAVDLWYPCERDDAVKKLKSLKKYEVSALNLMGDGFISPIVKVFKTLILSENLSPVHKFYYMFLFQYKFWIKLKKLITIRKKVQPNLSNYMLLHPQEQHQIKLIDLLMSFMLESTAPSVLSMGIAKQVMSQQTLYKKKFWKLMIDQTYKGLATDMNFTFNLIEKYLDPTISSSKKDFNSSGDFLFVNARGTHSSTLERINDNAQFFEFNNSQQTFLRYYFQFKHLLKDLFIENYSYKDGKTYIQLVPRYYDAWDNPVWKTHKIKLQPDVPMFFGTVLNFLRSIKADYESRFEVFSQNYPLLDSELNNKTALTTTWRKFKHKFFDMDAAVHRKATKKKKWSDDYVNAKIEIDLQNFIIY